jgi:hypothetical protein
MGIFDKIKSFLSDPENSDTSSVNPSGAIPEPPPTPTPPFETRNGSTVPGPDNASGTAPSGAPSGAVSPMMGLGMTGSAPGAVPASTGAKPFPTPDQFDSSEAFAEAYKEATAEAMKQAALSRNPPKNLNEVFTKATKDAEDKMRKDGFSESQIEMSRRSPGMMSGMPGAVPWGTGHDGNEHDGDGLDAR